MKVKGTPAVSLMPRALGALVVTLAFSSSAQSASPVPAKGVTDGAQPFSAPIQVGSALYGTTLTGGTSNAGTVYRLDLASGKTTTIYSFTGGSDGNGPIGVLLNVGNAIYGTTQIGGATNNGAVYKIDITTNQETTVYSFAGGTDGSEPFDGLIDVGGILFGTTENGGTAGVGTVFKIDPSSGAEAVVYSFEGYNPPSANDGAYPVSPLVQSGKLLYGTTYTGGNNDVGWGTVFSVNPDTGAEKIVHYFTRSDGYYPFAGMVTNGKTLYGTTTQTGSDAPGEVFAIDLKTGRETVVYAFSGAGDGGVPYGPVTLAGGTLYGTTSTGTGATRNGTIFAIDLASGTEQTVHRFGSRLGSPDLAGVLDVDGTLYGTTQNGGAAGEGTLYGYDPTAGKATLLHRFTGGT